MRDDEIVRAFIAIELPAELMDGLKKVQDELRDGANKVTWVKPGNIHFTVKFLGTIEMRRVDEIARVLEGVADRIKPFKLSVKEVGVFPSINNPRIVWVGLEESHTTLAHLYHRIENDMAALGFEREERSFKPHLTLGRVKFLKDKKGFRERFAKLKDIKLGEFTVDSISLFKSTLTPAGAIYTKLREVFLARGEE